MGAREGCDTRLAEKCFARNTLSFAEKATVLAAIFHHSGNVWHSRGTAVDKWATGLCFPGAVNR
jgi:hypothetical protein